MRGNYFKSKKTCKNRVSANLVTISVQSQFERLKASFPNLVVEEYSKSNFSVVVKLRPDTFSREYDVRFKYGAGKSISVFIVNEELKIAKKRTKLPHVYDTKLQRICLYGKDGGSWSSDKSIASIVVPWASEWLYYYELWLIDGEWLGGGHDEYANDKIKEDEKI